MEYELLAFNGLPLPEAHFSFAFGSKSFATGSGVPDKKPVPPGYTSSGNSNLYVVCTGQVFLTLSFHNENPTELFSNKTDSTITIHLPLSHFASIYTMLQEAFSKQKHWVKLRIVGYDSEWRVVLDFIPKEHY